MLGEKYDKIDGVLGTIIETNCFIYGKPFNGGDIIVGMVLSIIDDDSDGLAESVRVKIRYDDKIVGARFNIQHLNGIFSDVTYRKEGQISIPDDAIVWAQSPDRLDREIAGIRTSFLTNSQ